MERREEVRPDGHVLLTGIGPRGAVTLEAWMNGSKPFGVLGIHSEVPLGTGPGDRNWGSCSVLPGGTCFGDNGFTIGNDNAPALLAGDYEKPWEVIEKFYRQRIDINGEES